MSDAPSLTDSQALQLALACHTTIHPSDGTLSDFDFLERLGFIHSLDAPDGDDGYRATPEGNAHQETLSEAAQPARWRGQIVLDIDVVGGDDDAAMEAIHVHVAPILGRSCSIAERRLVLRQFFGRTDAPWQKQAMTANGTQLIDRALQVAELTTGGDWPDATKPDLHIHRQVLEEAIDHALRNNYRNGMNAGQRKYRPDLDRAIENSESPESVATLLRKFASRYDERGWSAEANLLRDAATQVDDITQDLKEPT